MDRVEVRKNESDLVFWVLAAAVAVGLFTPLTKAWLIGTDLGHGWAAPLLIAYLYWERWDQRPAMMGGEKLGFGPWVWFGAMFCLVAPLRFWLTPFPLSPAVVLVYVLMVLALLFVAAWLAGGRGLAAWIGGPTIILAAAIPWPIQIDTWVVQPLRYGLASLAAELINLTGSPALASGTTVRLGAGWVGVDEACGGIRSLQASVMTALFFGEWLKFSWVRRGGLVVVGIAAALSGNFLRIFFLAWRGTESQEAIRSAHDLAGWMALGVSLVVTGLVAWWWARKTVAHTAQLPVAARGGLGADFRKWGLTVAVVLLGIELANYAWYRHGEKARADVPQWTARFPVKHWSYKDQPLEKEARELLRPDSYVSGTWQADSDHAAGAYYVEWHRGQAARFVPVDHNPANCLPFTGCELVEELETFSISSAAGEIPFKTFLFRRASQRFIVAFVTWDPAKGEPLAYARLNNNVWERLKNQWNDVFEARKDQPGQLLTVALIGSDQPLQLKKIVETLIVPAVRQ